MAGKEMSITTDDSVMVTPDTKGKTFEQLVGEYGVRRDIAGALRVELKPGKDSTINEKRFVEALKKITTITPR